MKRYFAIVITNTIILSLMSSLVTARAASKAGLPTDESQPPEMSVWYRFEDSTHLDRSSSLASWPADCAYGTIVPGRVDHALSLLGKGGNGLYLPRPTAFFGTQPRAGTIALWVCPTNPDTNFVLVDFFRRSGNSAIDGNQIVIHVENKKLIARPSIERFMTIDNPLRRDEWTHIVLAWDCTQGTRFFVNGRKCGEGAAGFTPALLDEDWPGRIGGPTGCGAPFAGKLDDLRLWNRMLSDDEIRTVYQTTTPVSNPVTMDILEHEVLISNTSDHEIPLSLATWEAAAYRQPPYWGYSALPIAAVNPEHKVCILGPVPGQVIRTFILPAKGKMRIDIGNPSEHLGPYQIKLLAGKDIEQFAVASREFAGLTIMPSNCGLVILRQADTVTVNVILRNNRRSPFQGKLVFSLKDTKGTLCSETTKSLHLSVGGEKRENVVFACKVTPGKYPFTVRLANSGTVIEQFPVYITSDIDAARMHGTTTCWASGLTDGHLDQTASDGVDSVMIGRLGNYGTYEKYADMVLSRGMKLVIQSTTYYGDVCLNKDKRWDMIQYARNLGRLLANNPAVVMVTIAGEASSAPACYCQSCTEGFREWLCKEYGLMKALNAAWGTHFTDWSKISQLGSPEDIDQAAEQLKLMRIDLVQPADYSRRWQAIFERDRGRAMAWRKWQDAKLIGAYDDFTKNFHAGNGGLVRVGEQPCWPNFNSQNLFGAARVNDIGGMDLYLPGDGPTTLGYPAELFCNFDMNRSVFGAYDKPVVVNELYIQDNSPAGEAEAQGWWLTGRGYGSLDYFTYNYYLEGKRSGLPLIFGMFDKDAKPYPSYASFQRFCRDIRKFRALSGSDMLRPERPRIALFMGDDISRASALETGEQTWDAAGVHGHVGAYWLTERSGFPLDFINDNGFDRLMNKPVLIVPWAHVIRPESVQKIIAFASRGGTVIMDGPVGLYDDHYQPYSVLPGGKLLSSILGFTLSGYEDRPNRIILDSTTGASKQSVWYPFNSESTLAECADKTRQDTIQKAGIGDGKVGKGMVLSGLQNNGLYLTNPVAFFGNEAHRGTIALWVKPNFNPVEEKGQRVIIDFMRRSGNAFIDGHEAVIYTDKDKIVATPRLTLFTLQKASPFKKDEWTHLALTWDSRLGAVFYINGEKAEERIGGFTPIELDTDWPGRAGCQTSTGGAPFSGTLDELRLFNYALSAKDIRTLIGDADPRTSKLVVTGNWGLDVAGQGIPVNLKVTKGTVLLKDTFGNPALVETTVGKGRILSLVTNLGRNNRPHNPDPQVLKLWKSLLIEKTGLTGRYHFIPKTKVAPATIKSAAGGDVIFDLSVQIKDNRELYLFMVSFFGPSEGTLELKLPEGQYSALDAITGEKVALSLKAGKWELPVSIPAVGGRVIQIRPDKKGTPFVGW